MTVRTVALVLALVVASGSAHALTPADAARVDARAVVGTALPGTLRFRDEQGRAVTLGAYWVARPTVLVPGYFGCSNLCSVVLQGVAASLREAGLRAGRDVDVVAVSIDPQETPALALQRKDRVLADNGSTAEAAGWHFLTGDAGAVDALTEAIGYVYDHDEATGTYAHPAGLLVLAPGGSVRAQLGGVAFDAASLRRAILEGDPPTTIARWLLCFHDDPLTGRHSGAVIAATRTVGVGALLLLLAVIVRASLRARRMRGARSS